MTQMDEGSIEPQDAPGDADELVGQCEGQVVPAEPLCCYLEPCSEAVWRPEHRQAQNQAIEVCVDPPLTL